MSVSPTRAEGLDRCADALVVADPAAMRRWSPSIPTLAGNLQRPFINGSPESYIASMIRWVRESTVAVIAVLILPALLPASAAANHIPFTRAQVEPRSIPMVGKLRLVNDGVAASCSAAVIDAVSQSVALTAAHCVYSSSRGYPESGRFIPAYATGSGPFGEWPVKQYLPGDPWVLSGHSHYDWAFLILSRNSNGQAVEDVVGGLPIAFNQPRDQAYRILGYPAEPSPPFNGEQLWGCTTAWGQDFKDPDPDEQYGPPGMVAGCDMGPGASGGPWLNSQGVVSGVLSTTFGGHTGIVGSPFLGDEAAAKFALATGVPETATCNGLAVTHLGSPRSDVIRGTDGPDVIALGPGDDRVRAGAGADTICGDGGSDRINGGPGRDRCQGGPGRDRLKNCP